MVPPTIEVLGVYSIPVTMELLREQTDILYGLNLAGAERHDAERQCREQLESMVLIEVLVRDIDSRFDIGAFTQPQVGVPRDNWQVAWAEAYLSEDGEKLLSKRWSGPPKANSFRVAFFMQYWDTAGPLLTSYGGISCPPIEKLPVRLQLLVPYESVS